MSKTPLQKRDQKASSSAHRSGKWLSFTAYIRNGMVYSHLNAENFPDLDIDEARNHFMERLREHQQVIETKRNLNKGNGQGT